MTNQDIWDEARYLTYTDEETYSDTDLLRGTNILQREMFQSILQWLGFRKLNEDTYTTNFLTTNGLVAGQNGYNGEYRFDTTWVMVTGFSLKYPDAEYYAPAKIYDPDQYVINDVDADSYNAQFGEGAPEVHFKRNSYVIRPTITTVGDTVANGILITAVTRQSDLTLASQLPIGEQNFHQWYALKLALRYGKFRPGITRNDLLTELLLLEKKASDFYQFSQKTGKSLQPTQHNFA